MRSGGQTNLTQKSAADGGAIPLLTPFRLGPFQLSHRFPDIPGVWMQEQIEAWKPIVKAVHDKGAFFFLQIWHMGRVSNRVYQPNGQPPIASTNKRLIGKGVLPSGQLAAYSEPRALKTEEISVIADDFRLAARNAIAAGFDGVEIHGAHGYLDQYGGSLENRCRLSLEVVEAVAAEIGPEHVGFCLSPFGAHSDSADSNPEVLAVYMATALSEHNILYAHFIEPIVKATFVEVETHYTLASARKAFKGLWALVFVEPGLA